MENIHILDTENVESLINMFNSEEEDNIRIALSILNNADFTDKNIPELVGKLTNECNGLYFALFQNKNGDIRTRFHYVLVMSNANRYNLIDDDSSLDDDGWFPYEPHNDLNS